MFKIKLTAFLIISFYLPSISFAAFNGDCMNQEGKFKKCNIDFQDENLIIEFKNGKQSENNKTIPGRSMTALSSGEFSRRRVGLSLGLALINPVGLLGMLIKKQREQFGIEYRDGRGKQNALLFQVKMGSALGVRTNLQSISGLIVESGNDSSADN